MRAYNKQALNLKRNYHQPPSLTIIDRGCGDSACAHHISFLEEERRALAIKCDQLRVERDALEAKNSQLRHTERKVA
jgi:hypothetical protein